MKIHMLIAIVIVGVLVTTEPTAADSDSDEMKRLQLRIDALERRVMELERARSFATFMPEFAERFHVMHRAGEAGDWAVASHELNELERLTELSQGIDRKKGDLMGNMMAASFEALKKAIEHGNANKFEEALEQTINACNGCHVATDSTFIQVTLDAPDSLSMRHPHALEPRHAPSGHTHSH